NSFLRAVSHRITFLPPAPTAVRSLPSGENAGDRLELSARNLAHSRRELTSQTATVNAPSDPAYPAVASILPSGERMGLIPFTLHSSAGSSPPTSKRVVFSPLVELPSSPVDFAIMFAPAETACTPSTASKSRPAALPHSFTVPSWLTVANTTPEGEHLIELIGPVCPLMVASAFILS